MYCEKKAFSKEEVFGVEHLVELQGVPLLRDTAGPDSHRVLTLQIIENKRGHLLFLKEIRKIFWCRSATLSHAKGRMLPELAKSPLFMLLNPNYCQRSTLTIWLKIIFAQRTS